MATRAKAIRQFAKKFFNLDVSGMSEVAALKDFFKKKYDIDANGGSVTSLLGDVIENNDSLPSEETAPAQTVETKKVYMQLINETDGTVPSLSLSPCITSATEITATTKSLAPDGPEVEVTMLATSTWTFVFQSLMNTATPSFDVVAEYRNNQNQWVEAPFKYLGTPDVDDTVYAHYYVMNRIGSATASLMDGRHLRFRCVPKAGV